VPFITRLSKGSHAAALGSRKVVTYSMIFQLIMALNRDDPAIVRELLLRYQPEIAGNLAYYEELIEDALAYYREVVLPARRVEEPGHELDEALAALRGALAALRDASPEPEALQTTVFQVAKDRGIRTKDWFGTLYRLFLGQGQGPRVGTLFALLGLPAVLERLDAHLAGSA
jgi:lysyl-tRNA synthetase class 1